MGDNRAYISKTAKQTVKVTKDIKQGITITKFTNQ